MNRFHPRSGVTADMAVVAAEAAGVCIRPHVRTVTDQLTGDTTAVPIPCGSTREAVCGPCSIKARRLRMHQCREGWHLTHDPQKASGPDQTPEDGQDDDGPTDDLSASEEEQGSGAGRRVRSTWAAPLFPDAAIWFSQATVGDSL